LLDGIWDNRPENIELKTREEHLRDQWTMPELSIGQQMYGGRPDPKPQKRAAESL
jgi:hypothetical protein